MTNSKRWVNCPYCGHKMFNWIEGQWTLELKCPSCKKIFVLEGGELNVKVKSGMSGMREEADGMYGNL